MTLFISLITLHLNSVSSSSELYSYSDSSNGTPDYRDLIISWMQSNPNVIW